MQRKNTQFLEGSKPATEVIHDENHCCITLILWGAQDTIWFSKPRIHSDHPPVEAGLGAVSNPEEGLS